MDEELLVSKRTKHLLQGYLANPSQSLLFVGTKGLGVDLVAERSIAQLLNKEFTSLLINSTQVMRITPNDNGNISIDDIREAWHYSRVPASNADGKTKVVFVQGAQSMTREAQNSFLKLLEEPPEYMYFILTSPSEKLLLATVESRVQIVAIQPPPDDEIIAILSGKYSVDKSSARQAWVMSGNEPYTAIEIIEQGGSDELKLAKHILGLKPYDRITEFKDMLKDREKSLRLTLSLSRLCYLATNESVRVGKNSRSWLRRLKLSQETANNLRANANVRLNMVNLLSNL